MIDDIIFEPSGASKVNLNSLTSQMLTSEERRICEIYEVATAFVNTLREMISDGMSPCEVLSILSDIDVSETYSLADDVLSSNLPKLNSYFKQISAFDRAIFSSFINDILSQVGVDISENEFLATAQMPESFVYVKNAFSDEAYDVFSQEFSSPRVSYVNSFKDALSLVSDGAVSYCLLPIEERGARITTIDEMIFKGDFKVVSITPVLGFDGMADMKYALISRQFSEYTVNSGDDRYFEFRLLKDGAARLSDILIAAEHYNLEIYRLNTVRFTAEDDGRDYFSLILRSNGSDFINILIYLTLFADEFIPVGLYKNIE